MTTFTKLDGKVFPTSPDGLDASRISFARKSAKRFRQLKRRWVAATQSHDLGRQAMVLREWKSSGLVRIGAGLIVAMKLPLKKRPSISVIFETSNGLRLDMPTSEPAIARRKPKTNGFRYYLEFGLGNRTLQHLMRTLQSANFSPKPFQYEFRKGGIALAIRHIRNAILGDELFFAHLDVESCFPSFEEKEQAKIDPALKKMTIHNTGGHLVVIPMGPIQSLSKIYSAARRGAPQGSALSPLLWGKIVSKLEWKSETLLFNWADNFLILGQSKEAVEQALKTLIDKLAQLPGGKFHLVLKDKGITFTGFHFLGHWIKATNEGVWIEPSSPVIEKLGQRVEWLQSYVKYVNNWNKPKFNLLVERYYDCKACTCLADTKALIEAWGKTFSECDNIAKLKQDALLVFEPFRTKVGLSWDKLKEYQSINPKWDIYAD